MTRFFFITLISAVGFFGCNFPTKNIPETTPPPFLSSITLSSDSLPIITSPNNPTGATDTSIILIASVDTMNGLKLSDVRTVRYSIISLDGNIILAEGELSDDGVMPDVHAGDGKYTALVPLHITTENVGAYTVQILAENFSDLSSSTLSKLLTFVNLENHPPQLSNLVMPDTVFVPTSGSINVKISVAVTDSEGLSDIKSVTLTSQRPDGSNVGTYPMFDDGSAANQPVFGIPSGDAVAGDGIYTLTIPLPSSTERNTYRTFIFSATDRSGAASNTLSKKIYIE